MTVQNTIKNMAYDHPSYIARQSFSSVMAAGSGGVSGKFVAHTALTVLGLTAYTTTAGTSTYTATQYFGAQDGTSVSATVHAAVTQLSLIKITNTAAFGTAVALNTTTYGPFTVSRYYVNGTATGAVGVYAQFALNTGTGSAGLNGISAAVGDQLYVVNGTDATAVNLVNIDYQIAPLASVVA
jgi:hypothetical protein